MVTTISTLDGPYIVFKVNGDWRFAPTEYESPMSTGHDTKADAITAARNQGEGVYLEEHEQRALDAESGQ